MCSKTNSILLKGGHFLTCKKFKAFKYLIHENRYKVDWRKTQRFCYPKTPGVFGIPIILINIFLNLKVFDYAPKKNCVLDQGYLQNKYR